MLDAETKARIDSARDILVGKVPDPKSQVEQITIALIYKFMDDMDRQSEELGGKATFFTGEFTKYRWPNLLDKRHGGHERLLLYAEGIEKMNENANIPQLFRDIFRGVFLPYRDPETLNLFLKEIDGFTYDHSERLGDAYEYLLSVLGTQGDAGQFRTPRHIIDFIVAVVDPQKHETVLDPACGTAGFLISAFKHILKANENLTPDERARLMTNFRGYDIAPDMVRLSRVNMYLHSFPNPVIHEYDALTSEERWDERCDVIMANPPFMTPKGVIVPEGIIFQSQNAYKGLRKMLVENYLWAVVSLPAGVFNPYSGVKTSILFLDRNLARRTDEVLFVKIENDGFDLGAQRRPFERNDLPEALKAIEEWRATLYRGRDEAMADATKRPPSVAHAVNRKRLLESPDCNLSGDRYRPAVVRANGKWPMVKLGEVCSFEYGSSLPEKKRLPGPYPVVGSNGITGFHDEFTVKGPTIVVGRKGSAGEVTWIDRDCVPIDTTYYIQLKTGSVLLRYLFYVLQQLRLTKLRDGAGVPGLNRNDAYEKEIPLPPLEEQEQIVAELEGYRKVIKGARYVIANYKPTIRIDPAWPTKKVAQLCDLVRGSSPRPKANPRYYGGKVPRLMVADLTRDGMYVRPQIDFLTEEGARFSRPMKRNEVVMAVSGNPGLPAILGVDAYIHDGFVGFRNLSKEIGPEFLYHLLSYFKEHSDSLSIGAVFKNLTTDQIKDFDIPLPPLGIQHQIVADLEAERAMVEANRDLAEIFEKKIQAKLAEIWGEEEGARA
jgi:type I restriction enzyme M protein